MTKARTIYQRMDFMEQTVGKLWDEIYKLQEEKEKGIIKPVKL